MTQVPQLARHGIFDRRLPHYASYPTVDHFGPAIGPDQFSDWVRAIPTASKVSLYLHIPFCRRLCGFCAYRTQATTSPAAVAAYVDALNAELSLLARLLPPGVTMSRMQWGGGTPTLLTPAMTARLATAIDAVLPRTPSSTFTVEIDPTECDADRVAALARAGLTHAMIGVQDFDPRIQQAIGRAQSAQSTARIAEILATEGVAGLDIDVVHGLPLQTEATLGQTLQAVLALSPGRVTLTEYAHVPWMSRRQTSIAVDALPSPATRDALAASARRRLLRDGYQQIGIDRFARPGDPLVQSAQAGRLRLDFQGYGDDPADVLIGLGASSISRFPQGYAQNASRTSDYLRMIGANGLATERGHGFAGEDQVRGHIIQALLCDFSVSRADVLGRFTFSPQRLDQILSGIALRFPEATRDDGATFRIRPEARQMARLIARACDRYDRAGPQPA